MKEKLSAFVLLTCIATFVGMFAYAIWQWNVTVDLEERFQWMMYVVASAIGCACATIIFFATRSKTTP